MLWSSFVAQRPSTCAPLDILARCEKPPPEVHSNTGNQKPHVLVDLGPCATVVKQIHNRHHKWEVWTIVSSCFPVKLLVN